MKKKNKKWLGWFLTSLMLIGIALIYLVYGKLYAINTSFPDKQKLVFIHDTIAFSDWIDKPENQAIFIKPHVLKSAAELKRFKTMKPGRYSIKKGMSNNSIINLFRSSQQTPFRVRTDRMKTLEKLAGHLGRELMADSASFMRAFTNPANFADSSFNETTVACMIRPNTYEFYWTISPDEFMERMKGYYRNYWTPERIALAKKQNLTPVEATILASIVKAETTKNQEASKIAGLYLNRLRIGMPLQSDPTAVFGKGIQHVQRVTDEINHPSAYNTYLNKGLPPGPINFPEEIYIEAVLHPAKHNYLYMCAQPGKTGYHNFAQTFEQHQVYAKQYRNWLDNQGIR